MHKLEENTSCQVTRLSAISKAVHRFNILFSFPFMLRRPADSYKDVDYVPTVFEYSKLEEEIELHY